MTNMTKLFLFNIQGTTTEENFFSKVLIPYSKYKLKDFISNHKSNIALQNEIKEIKLMVSKVEKRQIESDQIFSTVMKWIDERKEIPAVNKIQNLIWDIGYSKNQIRAHLYDDVSPFFKKIINSGGEIGIFSSIPVHAQKLIFSYSPAGDITPLISYYFDTKIGQLEERTSFCNIACAVHCKPQDIHFFSANPNELLAAQSAEYKVTLVNRNEKKNLGFETIINLEDERLFF